MAERAIRHDVEAMLLRSVESAGATCVGTVFTTLAAAASMEGRVRDVSRYADRAIQLLENEHPRDDPILLRPLAFLCAAHFEMSHFSKANSTFQRLSRTRADTPEQRALVHALGATLLERDGRLDEATNEMRAAIAHQEEGGLLESADQVWYLQRLALLHAKQREYPDARQAVARANAVLANARDATALDRIRLLETAGVIEALEGDWRASERSFSQALSFADASPTLDRDATRGLLVNYAAVLRKVGRGKDARVVEQRLNALPPDPSRARVDITELAGGARR